MKMAMCRSKWVLPLSIVALGVAMFVAEWTAGIRRRGSTQAP